MSEEYVAPGCWDEIVCLISTSGFTCQKEVDVGKRETFNETRKMSLTAHPRLFEECKL